MVGLVREFLLFLQTGLSFVGLLCLATMQMSVWNLILTAVLFVVFIVSLLRLIKNESEVLNR